MRLKQKLLNKKPPKRIRKGKTRGPSTIERRQSGMRKKSGNGRKNWKWRRKRRNLRQRKRRLREKN